MMLWWPGCVGMCVPSDFIRDSRTLMICWRRKARACYVMKSQSAVGHIRMLFALPGHPLATARTTSRRGHPPAKRAQVRDATTWTSKVPKMRDIENRCDKKRAQNSGPISQKGECRQYSMYYFVHFGGPGSCYYSSYNTLMVKGQYCRSAVLSNLGSILRPLFLGDSHLLETLQVPEPCSNSVLRHLRETTLYWQP